MLGKAPGLAVSDNVMKITVTGPSKAEAIRRANAVATAFLAFRSQQYNAQAKAVNAGLGRQIASLQSDATNLSNEINGSVPIPAGKTVSDLVSQRAQDTSSIVNLEQTVQQNQVSSVSLAKGSQIITPGTVAPGGKVKAFALAGATGLIAGLGIGVGIVLIGEFTSNKLRRREDIAGVMGAPIELSVGPVQLSRLCFDVADRVRLAKKPPPPDAGNRAILARLTSNGWIGTAAPRGRDR